MSADDKNSASNYAPKSPDLSSFYLAPRPPLHHPRPPSSVPIDFNSSLPSAPDHGYYASSSSSYPPHVATSRHHGVVDPGYPGHSPSAQQYRLPPNPRQSTSPFQAVPYGQQSPALLHRQQPQPAHLQQAQVFSGQIQQYPGVQLPQHYLEQPLPSPTSCPPVTSVNACILVLGRFSGSRPAVETRCSGEPGWMERRLPTARIKRIMQADEEVGKVAQQTPIAVGKALELFMVQLVSKSADVAKDKGSKRVTASMLKQVVETDDQWDFLREIVSRVETEKEGSRAKAKPESESEEEEPEPKRRGRGAGRRKRA
ncbi:Histone-fold domain containing protein [Ophiocordyceps sinensis CO18]|uniref:Histone-fold domain containing protein n=1 Tax=Ophiocordyceps sinensis (strain Co18 / CGMCC 3.14243) TaxID=911162 RepID=T5ABE7_OPHSC|nr:Histone-fold domain containing protein [Ophiocordyceps sinensis CO18]